MMNKFGVILGALVIGTVGLTGCSADYLTLEGKVDNLADEVQVLQGQMNTLETDLATVQEDATRANERLDNLATTYSK